MKILYCIRNFYDYEEKKESFSYKWIFKPICEGFEKFSDWISSDSRVVLILSFPFIILSIAILFFVYVSIRKFAFKKNLIFKCNCSYRGKEDDNFVYMPGHFQFIKKIKINDIESIMYPKLSRYFTDLKGYRKHKLKKIKKN